jgi:hypothetical protein
MLGTQDDAIFEVHSGNYGLKKSRSIVRQWFENKLTICF